MKNTKAINYLPLLSGVFIGTTLFLLLDVIVSISLIDFDDSTTWPNMHPGIRIIFIPVFGSLIAIMAIVFEAIRNFLWKTNINNNFIWLLLGVSYTSFLSMLFLGRFLQATALYTAISLIVFLCNPFLIHYHFGRSG